ncbi:OmpH family outer membrane protein [Salipiger thiooxidans]|uniref:OmpH family outer membrane protein n=1 Tax=Salipiger thiooxidans TaxID=282683 RepID=UPI001CD3131D|nr:OmpH family outer membrane protein [Salipiger thiooxidans]MCA0847632.1 OmpH family outer membrane protein [Salipiger thiooxidans]
MRRALRQSALALALALAGAPLAAQEATRPGVVQSVILTVEFDRLFGESAYGRRVTAALEEEGAAISAENRRIEAALTDEERALTEKRGTVPPAEFRKLADAFDQKVQELRRGQDAKARALGNVSEERRRQFMAAAQPVLADLMKEAGAAVILDERSVFLAADVIDITDTAISRIDEAIGDGSAEAPQGEPDTQTDVQPEAQPGVVPGAQPDIVPEAQPDVVPDTQPQARPDGQPQQSVPAQE